MWEPLSPAAIPGPWLKRPVAARALADARPPPTFSLVARQCVTKTLMPHTFIFLFLLSAPAVDSPDRTVAEWTLSMGGRVRLAGQSRYLTDIVGLPSHSIQIEALDWVGVNSDPPDLERLSALRGLKELHLPGPFWNRNADGGRDGSKDLRFLAGVTTLEVLTFSDHFLDRVRFKDEGLAEIKGLTNLRELVLHQSDVTGKTLAPFRKLEALDVTLCPVDDKGLESLHGMTSLRRLRLGDTLITDASMRVVGEFTNLEELDLHGTAITDAGVQYLKGLSRLKKLNLMGCAVTDTSAEVLARLRGLEELNLYRTRIGNGGASELQGLKQLSDVDLRYSRVTRGGIDALRAARPAARILYVEQSARPRIAGDLFRPSPEGTLTLSGAAITDADLEKLSTVPQLRKLSLEATEIGDAGAHHLARLVGLVELNLSNTQITDSALAHLSGLRGLRKLNLANTYVEGSGTGILEGTGGTRDSGFARLSHSELRARTSGWDACPA